jgi:hypothetical protein
MKGRGIVREIKAINDKLVFDIEESDTEVLFKFKANDFDTLEKYIKPKEQKSKNGTSPFSTKHLDKNNDKEKYEIPLEDLALYKEITTLIPKGNISVYLNINNGFMAELARKNNVSVDSIKSEIKNSKLGQRDYFYSIGVWKDYIEYIKLYLKENL